MKKCALICLSVLFIGAGAKKSLPDLIKALKKVEVGSKAETKIRHEVIRRFASAPPETPEAVVRHMARGEAFVETAESRKGFLRAAKEFRLASIEAPWLAQPYYNQAVVLDKGGDHDGAIRSLGFFLKVVPKGKKAKAARKLMYKIEARKEAAQENKAEARAAARKKSVDRTKAYESLSGKYSWSQSKGSLDWDIKISNGKISIFFWWKDKGEWSKWGSGSVSPEGRISGSQFLAPVAVKECGRKSFPMRGEIDLEERDITITHDQWDTMAMAMQSRCVKDRPAKRTWTADEKR